MTSQLTGSRATRSSRTCAAILIACAVIIGAVWAVTYQRITFEREYEIEQAVQSNRNLAIAFEEHTKRTIKMTDQGLQMLASEYLQVGERMPAATFERLGSMTPGTFVFFDVADARGWTIFSAGSRQPVNLADRDYFSLHRDHPEAGVRVEPPAIGRVTGKTSIRISRGIRRPDGSFAGVALAGLDPLYFSGFYDRLDLGRNALVELVSLEGFALSRNTGQGEKGRLDMRGSTLVKRAATEDSGDFLSLGRYDGVPRHVSFRVMRELGLLVAVGASREYVLEQPRKRQFWYLIGSAFATVFVLLFGSGIVAALRRQRRAMDAARAGEALYRVTFEKAAAGIAHNTLDGKFIRANAEYCALVGYTQGELRARTFMDVLHPDDVPSPEAMQRVLRDGGIKEVIRHVRKDGAVRACLTAVSVVRDAAGQPQYFVAMVQDVTERNEAQAKLLHQTHYDTLTGLPNRMLLLDRLGQVLRRAERGERTVGALFVNLDRFKAVNDTFGHSCGDELLRAAAERLSHAVRAEDTVAHVGGDEFVVVLAELADARSAAQVAGKIVEAFTSPFTLAGREVFVTASVGIAIYPGDGEEGEALIRNANAAMARAKQIGRNNFQYYAANMNERAAEKLLLEADLRRALERNEFLLHYQPKVTLATGRISGVEALLRWQRADGKLVSPGDFIPLLEETGMIGAVGAWVIRAACAQIRQWQQDGFVPVPVAVNVSTRQFLLTDIDAVVGSALGEFGVEPRLLEIEITESDVMQDRDRVVPVLSALNARGVRIAVDDFGTGYSSLGYLAQLPVQTLKIDRSFIIRMNKEPNAMTLVSTMISLAHSLRLKVVAEGVETENQSSLLRLLRCDEMQGYLFSRPIPAENCIRYLDCAAVGTPVELVAA
jgi:diguanylate cyclase (GGDEF)-like protein/PAS domain S-box-containing protein